MASDVKRGTEIGIQVQVEKTARLLRFLEKNGKFVGESHQVDKYFTPVHRDFTSVRPVNEWLRLRDASGKNFINYKNWHRGRDGRSHYCDEFETVVEDLGQLEKIFGVLDIKPIVIVGKVRKLWRYKDYEISLDLVEGLGDFVEVEYKGKSTDETPEEVTNKMVKFLKKLGCGKLVRNYSGYPYMLLFPKEAKFEEY